jgi:gluconokinase
VSAAAAPVVVMGVSGAGKSTIGAALAVRYDGAYVDGDDLHPPANVERMRAGTPLTDDDRWPWLDTIGRTLAAADRPLFLACSALKRVYRDRILEAAPATRFLHLDLPRAVLEARMAAREGHYMPASLLDSQLATLEPLEAGEPGVVLDATLPPLRIVEDAARWLG